jgi:hypothetical protein
MSNRTTPTGRHRRGWERRKAHQGRKKDIQEIRQKVAIYGREEVAINDEDEGSMEWRNNVRYLRMN